MSKRYRSLGWGCLPAAFFGLAFGLIGLSGLLLRECVHENRGAGSCPNERLEVLTLGLLTALLCVVIMWTTNGLVRALGARGIGVGWGVAAGCLLSAILLVGVPNTDLVGLLSAFHRMLTSGF